MAKKVELEVPMLMFWAPANSTSYVYVSADRRQHILIDPTNFTNPTFYFEAVLMAPAADNISYARLYNVTDDVAVENSELSASELDWTRKRSGAISLSGSKQYAVQIRNTTASGLVILGIARITIVCDATSLTILEHQVEVGNVASTTSETMVEIGYASPCLYEGAKFDGTLTVTFEVTGYVQSKTGEFELYNRTDGESVSGSLLSTTSTSPVRLRSGAITLTSGKEYTVRFRNTAGKITYVGGAKIVILQEKGDGITKTQVTKVVGTHDFVYAEEYENCPGRQGSLDLAMFEGFNRTFYFEVCGYSQWGYPEAKTALRNLTDATIVSNSEHWMPATVTRLRSGSLTLLTTKEYVSCSKSQLGESVYVHIARVIIDLTPPVPPPVVWGGSALPQLQMAKAILGL